LVAATSSGRRRGKTITKIGLVVSLGLAGMFIAGIMFGMPLIVADENYYNAEGLNHGCYVWTWPFNEFLGGCNVENNLLAIFIWALSSLVAAAAITFGTAYMIRKFRS
jgi:hypothetical protein